VRIFVGWANAPAVALVLRRGLARICPPVPGSSGTSFDAWAKSLPRSEPATAIRHAILPTLLLFFATAAQAQTEPVSFAGKSIKLLIGFSPTGYGYDTYGRLLARHIGKHLPGNPAIIPQNRPGAGSLNLASYMANAAPRDGSEIAIVGRGVAMEPLIGGSAAQGKFDSTKFAWLGSMNNEVSGLFIRQGAPAASLQEILAGARLQMGSTGAGGDQQVFTIALNSLLGTKLKPIAGYPGTQEIMLAIQRGELDGIVGYSWGVARAGNRDDLATGRLKIVMQLGLEKHKELPTIPMLDDFVTAPMDRQVLDLIFSRQAMGRPLLAPPGIDPRVTQALRAAFADAMRDPQLIAEGARMDLELGFVGGADVQATVERGYKSPPEVIARAQTIAAAN
jgi:tripartite-type tricarboxylate transporter receptor subunit TctC